MTASDSWHPATPVSFPESDYSTVRVEFSHQGGVQFGTATTRSPGEPNFDAQRQFQPHISLQLASNSSGDAASLSC